MNNGCCDGCTPVSSGFLEYAGRGDRTGGLLSGEKKSSHGSCGLLLLSSPHLAGESLQEGEAGLARRRQDRRGEVSGPGQAGGGYGPHGLQPHRVEGGMWFTAGLVYACENGSKKFGCVELFVLFLGALFSCLIFLFDVEGTFEGDRWWRGGHRVADPEDDEEHEVGCC